MISQAIQTFLEKCWYEQNVLCRIALWPFSIVYRLIVKIKSLYGALRYRSSPRVPIIVVGNLTVGGTGKTPLVIALAQAAKDRGIRVGIVSRGYGATVRNFPHTITTQDTPMTVGDEPFLIAQKTQCPVVIAPKRQHAVNTLIDVLGCELIISDDGLQHQAMPRTVEIVVVDGMRGFGNGLCLPAGPLREPLSRLKKVDFVVVNGENTLGLNAYTMQLVPGALVSLIPNTPVPLIEEVVAAVAGIGHPERFFNTLTSLELSYYPYVFPDHYAYTPESFSTISTTYIVMTEKDAVKCTHFAKPTWYFLPVDAVVDQLFWEALWSHEGLKGLNA